MKWGFFFLSEKSSHVLWIKKKSCSKSWSSAKKFRFSNVINFVLTIFRFLRNLLEKRRKMRWQELMFIKQIFFFVLDWIAYDGMTDWKSNRAKDYLEIKKHKKTWLISDIQLFFLLAITRTGLGWTLSSRFGLLLDFRLKIGLSWEGCTFLLLLLSLKIRKLLSLIMISNSDHYLTNA